MLVKGIMAPFTLLAWCFACIYVTLFSGPRWSLDWLSARQEAWLPWSPLALGGRACLGALGQDPGWFLLGHVSGNLRQTATRLQPSAFPAWPSFLRFLFGNKSLRTRMWQVPVSVFLGGPWEGSGPERQGSLLCLPFLRHLLCLSTLLPLRSRGSKRRSDQPQVAQAGFKTPVLGLQSHLLLVVYSST